MNAPAPTVRFGLLEKVRLIFRAWRYRRRSERGPTRFVVEYLKPGQTVLDVGANKGAYTYWFCRAVGAAGRVVAFEPQPELSAYLVALGRAFGFTQLRVVPAAASSAAGRTRLVRPDDNPSGGATLELSIIPDGHRFEVAVVKIDDVVETGHLGPVHLIKCDVQGHEHEVFAGAARTIRRDRPVLVFECIDNLTTSDGQIDRIFAQMASFGYEGWFFEKSGAMRPVSEFDLQVRQGNYLSPLYAHDFMFRARE